MFNSGSIRIDKAVAMVKVKQLRTPQQLREALLFVSLLLFPITLYYFSPAMIIAGAAAGVVAGSFIAIGWMFRAAVFLGKLWCGWACPAGAGSGHAHQHSGGMS